MWISGDLRIQAQIDKSDNFRERFLLSFVVAIITKDKYIEYY